MNTKIIISTVLSFVIGFGLSTLIFMNLKGKDMAMHQMPDGSMMMNDGSSMEGMMHDMNASLVGKTGDQFDAEFLSQMIVHHEGAVDMAQKVLEVSERPELTKLANEIIAAQTKEIAQMKLWQQKWFNK